MAETPASLNDMSRRDLSELARTLGIADAEVMTRAELRAAIARSQTVPRAVPSPWPTTWLGVARGLIASIVEQGLNLPDAAALIRGDTKLSTPPKPPPPVATVTLARIYVAQGHLQRAIDTLGEVLLSEPDHEVARELRDELVARKGAGRAAPVDATPIEPAAPSAAVESAPLEPVAVDAPAAASTEAAPPPGSELEPSYGEPAPTQPEAPPTAEATLVESVAHTARESEPPGSEPPPTLDERLPLSVDAPSAPAAAATPPVPEASAASERPARVSPRREPPRPPAAELVLIETDAPATYLYWELSTTVPQPVSPEQCSLLIVAHTPALNGAQRVERRLSLTSARGALRLIGLPERSVLRALLSRDGTSAAYKNGAPTNKALAVAGAVRAQEPPSDPAILVTFSPSPTQYPADLALRAVDRLADAGAVHW